MKTLIIFFTIILSISSCKKTEYQDTYGPQVPPGTLPYNLGQEIKFENGIGDTIIFRCTKYQSEEYVGSYPCKQEHYDCYIRHHQYKLNVDLKEFGNSRIFNLMGYSDGILLEHYNHIIPGFTDFANSENMPFPNSSGWSDSIKLNSKTFYNYSTQVWSGWINNRNTMFTDTIRYSKQDGIIMFSTKCTPQNTYERWVLVK